MKDKNTRIKYVFALNKYIRAYRLELILSILIHAVYKLLPILIGFVTALTVGEAIIGNLSGAFKYFYIILALIATNALFNYLDILISHDMAYKILTELRNQSFEKVAQIAPGGIEAFQSGDIMTTILEDVEILEWFFAHTTNQIIVATVLPIGSLIVLGYFSVWIALLIILFIVVIIITPIYMKEKSNKQGLELQDRLGKLNSIIIDGIQGLKDIVTFQWEKGYLNNLFKANRLHSEALEKYTCRANNESVITNFLIGVSYIASTVLILVLNLNGHFQIKWVLPLIILSSAIYSPLQETLSMSSNYGRIFGAAERVFLFLNAKSMIEDTGTINAKEVLGNGSEHKISFENVEFTYPNIGGAERSAVCKGINFEVSNCETAVLVGTSGCGKSTCIKLLQRFWDTDKGEIKINGINIKEIKLEELKSLISVVPQDVYIFNMSILDNLRLAKPNAGLDEINQALKKANAFDFVKSLENGIHTIVGEKGTKLSGGEKQRISIAQAFLRDSKIILLDEVSANLDSDNEEKVNESIKALKKGKLTLMIAHRVSSIKAADKIIVIKDGKVQDCGTYDELISYNEYFKYLIGHNYG